MLDYVSWHSDSRNAVVMVWGFMSSDLATVDLTHTLHWPLTLPLSRYRWLYPYPTLNSNLTPNSLPLTLPIPYIDL